MNKRKSILLLAALTLLLTAMVGGTVAYLFTSTATVENVFEPAEVVPEIHEEFDNTVKKDVRIWNSGSVDAYIRAAVVVTWKNGNNVIPAKSADYTWSGQPSDSNWLVCSDGFFYYTQKVAPSENYDESEATTQLIGECKVAEGVIPPEDGYALHVEILAQAIQADPDAAVEEAWPAVKVTNGQLTLKLK